MERKLKPDESILGLALSLSIVLIFGLTTLFFGYAIGFTTAAVLIWIYALYMLIVFVRTGNLGHLVSCAYMVFLGYMALLAPANIILPKSQNTDFRAAYISGILFFAVIMGYLVVTKKLKWRGRELFELAAASVDEIGNGYTSRPMPIGKAEFTQDELLSFARYISRNLIAISTVSPKQVIFIPVKMGDEYAGLLKMFGYFHDSTWISFDFEGDVSVHISQKDYLDYKEPLAFNKLCESLGQVFINFAELHKKGEGVRIIDRLNALKMGYFS